MAKAYLLAYGTTLGTTEEVKGLVNQIPEIIKWRYDMSNAFYLISDLSADALTDKIYELAPKKGRFIVSEIPANSSGYLTPESWYLIQNKKYKPKSDDKLIE